jgi:hypothetical protein
LCLNIALTGQVESSKKAHIRTSSGITGGPGIDRNDETQIVPFKVRRNFPTSGLWNGDEGHYARSFTARNENGIRMRHRDRRRFAIKPFARHNKFGFGFLYASQSRDARKQACLDIPSHPLLCGTRTTCHQTAMPSKDHRCQTKTSIWVQRMDMAREE